MGPEIGCPIFNDDHTNLIGFIYEVQEQYMDIVLFEPEDLDFEPDKILEMSLSWEQMLVQILQNARPPIKEYWKTLFSDNTMFKRIIH